MNEINTNRLTYEPKKTFLEKIRELIMPFLIFLLIILIIAISSYLTYYILEKNINSHRYQHNNLKSLRY